MILYAEPGNHYALVILLSKAEGNRLIFYVNVVVLLNERDR